MVMGIVNVTPDSFSDGGRYLNVEGAVEHALRLVREGADILDIGGESTRPRAVAVEEAEELRRVLPVIEALVKCQDVPISIDTQKPGVARRAIEAGAVLVNDIAANRTEGAMWRVVAETGAGYVAMHMRGTPATMQDDPRYEDVAGEIAEFFRERLETLAAFGVGREQVALDPGVGFGKTLEQNVELLSHLKEFMRFDRPVVLGVSRKSFLGGLTGAGVQERMPAGLACCVWGAMSGVRIIRTHDVAPTVQALRVTEAISARAT